MKNEAGTPEDRINLLFLSAGRRVELLRSFRKAYAELGISGSILAADIDPLAPALQEADFAHLVPKLDNPSFVTAITEICRRERVSAVIPLTDRDLPVLSEHRAEIEATGARVLLLREEGLGIATDKLRTNRFFELHGVPAPRSWSAEQARAETLAFPLHIRPRNGSGGEGAFPVRSQRELDFFLDYVREPIVQEYLDGPEITSDVFCDFDSRVLSVVCRRRIEVRWGEVAKGVTMHHPEILERCAHIARALEAVGPLTIQCILKDGHPYFTEINARFGGGAPLAFAAGPPIPEWTLALVAGLRVTAPPLGTYTAGLYLARFDDAFLLNEEDRACVGRSRL